MPTNDPFHNGERFVQDLANERDRADRTAAVMRTTILPAAFDFLARRESIVLASRDADGEVWASLLWGTPGVVTATDEATLLIDLTRAVPDPGDPLWTNLSIGAGVGTLVIDLQHRRRYRINGQVARYTAERLEIAVSESYPNCPKYIQAREVVVGVPAAEGATTNGTALTDEHRAWLAVADTLLTASGHPERGLDASHRGGIPGFVQFVDDATVRIPDYSGNSLYNTLGNLHVDPHVGLLLLDFEHGRQLQLLGRATIRQDLPAGDDRTGGTGRSVDIALTRWRQSDLPVALNWTPPDPSPFNPD